GPIVPFPGSVASRTISISVSGPVSGSFVLNLHSSKLLDLLNLLLNSPSAVSSTASALFAPTESSTTFARDLAVRLPESKSMMTKIEIKDVVEVNVAEYVPPERPPLSTCEFVVGPQAPKCRECI